MLCLVPDILFEIETHLTSLRNILRFIFVVNYYTGEITKTDTILNADLAINIVDFKPCVSIVHRYFGNHTEKGQ